MHIISTRLLYLVLLYLYNITKSDSMEKTQLKKMTMNMTRSGFSNVGEDVMQNILSRLPASAFSSAACVNKCWNNVCGRILTKPKFASALSLKPILRDAVKEVLDKVLCEPIVPHFAIAYIGTQFSLAATHQLLTEKLGSSVPLITSAASGIIGADVVTNEFREVRWESSDDEEDNDDSDSDGDSLLDRGIVLVIGFVPGLKVDAIPLLRTKMVPQISLVENFLTDIKNFTASFSDSESPAGIILFGDRNIDMRPILARMDCALDEETVIVGDASGYFLWKSAYDSQHYDTESYLLDVVALVFARDIHKSKDIGETQFHVTLSTGIMPFGPQLQAICVVAKDTARSWLTARAERQFEILDNEGVLGDINIQFEDEDFPDVYIGVVQHRLYSCGSESFISRASLAFYEVLGGEGEYFIVNGVGIKPGDTFLFYHSDPDTATSSCNDAYRNLEILKKESKGKNFLPLRNGQPISGDKEVFGGLIFSSYLRGETFHPNVDSSPLHENFPEVPVAGVFCNGEIGRGSSSSISQEDDETNYARCCLHYHSTVYLALSYTPPT